MAFLSLKNPSSYSIANVYCTARFSIACYSTFTNTKKELRCSQTVIQSLNHNETIFISKAWMRSNKKIDLKYKTPSLKNPLLFRFKQNTISVKNNRLSSFEKLGYGKLTINKPVLTQFHKEELIKLCKQFNQTENWVPSLSYYSKIDEQYKLNLAFKSLMNTCLHIEFSTDHSLEKGFAFNEIYKFISSYLDEIHIQLEELNDIDINNNQLQIIATNIDTGMNFAQDLLHFPLVKDAHLHWFCVDRIDFLIDQCFDLGKKLHEKNLIKNY